ncbi:hypothetical protein [Crossiella sp. CA198]|uniref:hypothetical protein n=1 Tax=Crossiella sp. CA198 TaxID=3455607 RepID=UPI003F8D0219
MHDAVLCAGTVLRGCFTELPTDTFHHHMAVNSFGTVNAVRSLCEALRAELNRMACT